MNQIPTEYDTLDGGPQSQLDLLPLWRFTLGKRDALLVLKALGGRLSRPPEIEDALELGDRLTLQRAAAARELMNGLEKAENAALIKDR